MGFLGMYCCEGYGFQAVYSGMGYINQRVWVQNWVSFSRKLINWLQILVQTRETGNCHSKTYLKKSNRFCFGWTMLVTSVVSGKLLIQDGGDLGSLVQYQSATSAVQDSKIQLNQLWYRLRVPGSWRQILTQKILKYHPPSPVLVHALDNALTHTISILSLLMRRIQTGIPSIISSHIQPKKSLHLFY